MMYEISLLKNRAAEDQRSGGGQYESVGLACGKVVSGGRLLVLTVFGQARLANA